LPVHQVCFETRVDGRVAVRCWGDDQQRDGIRYLRLWTEYPSDDWGASRSTLRTVEELRAEPDLRPLRYSQLNEHGATVRTVVVEGTSVRAVFADGTVVERSLGAADFILAANAIPLLSAKLAEIRDRLPYRGAFFSPEALDAVPYTVWVQGGTILSSHGDVITLDEQGLVGLENPRDRVTVQRVDAPLPAWARRRGATKPVADRQPEYAPPAGVERRDGSMLSEGGSPLGYTLVRPSTGEVTATALFIGGSGTHDRHGFAGDLDLGYHQLLDGLCRHGVASVRFDKRGSSADTPLGQDFQSLGFTGLVDNARRCLPIAAEPGPPVLIGHSEGGLVALLLALESPASPRVLLATAAQPIDQVLEWQIETQGRALGLSPEGIEAQRSNLREFFGAVRTVDDAGWVPGGVSDRLFGMRAEARYYRQLLAVDPLAVVRRARSPVLIVHGEEDQQVPVQDAHALADAASAAGADVGLVIAPHTNHLLKSAAQLPSVADYFDRRRRVKRDLIRTIGAWISERSPTR
jgi:pimeloyl-ACP methyl ester carboxylesterase